jgi:hypothetical protein
MSIAMVDDPIPLKLRANDVVTHVVNIDSEFRDDPRNTDTGNFQVTMLSPVRNVLRVRLDSVEAPAVGTYPSFSARRGNTCLRILYRDLSNVLFSVGVYVDDAAEYDGPSLAAAVSAAIAEAALPIPLTVTWDASGGRFVFATSAAGADRYGIDATRADLAQYMGFSRKLHAAVRVGGSTGVFTLWGDNCVDLTVDRYLFVRINDFAGVRQTVVVDPAVTQHDFVALAKIVWNAVDRRWRWSGGSVVFPAPRDLLRFQVQVVDRYGDVVPLCGLPVSMALEVMEVRNSTMYNVARDGLAVVYQ